MTARRMRRTLRDAHDQRTSLIVTKLMKTGLISGWERTLPPDVCFHMPTGKLTLT
jgi:hypothetical protein